MTEKKSGPMWVPEGPVVIPAGGLKELADQVADWICDDARLDRGWAVGIWGGRGSGKTSFLLTLQERLRKLNPEAPKAPIMCLPGVPGGGGASDTAALFSPSDTRAQDSLLFRLLDHLYKYRHDPSLDDAFDKVREAAVREIDPERFLRYAEDVSAAAEELPKDLVEAHNSLARTTTKLQSELERILTGLTGGGKQRLVLLVDDLDLRPNRALEMLEMVYLFLQVKGVIVLITADRDLLYESLSEQLKERSPALKMIASPMLSKLVPYGWHLPVPPIAERFLYLWDELGELPKWWDEGALVVLNQISRRPLRGGGEEPDASKQVESDDEVLESKFADSRAAATHYLAGLLPDTYRGLKSLHNGLLALRLESGSRDARLPAQILRPFLTLVACIEAWDLALGVLDPMLRSPHAFAEALDRLAPVSQTSSSDEGRAISRRVRPRGFGTHSSYPILDRLQAPWFRGRRLGEAIRRVRELARVWTQWTTIGPRVVPSYDHFLSVSLDDDAMTRGVGLWKGVVDPAEADRWHLDLRQHGSGRHPTPDDLRNAAKEASRRISEAGIAATKGRVGVLAKARLPFLIWLGWELRYLDRVVAYNDFQGRFVAFEGPRPRIAYSEVGEFRWFQVGRQESDYLYAGKEASILVDFKGKSSSDQMRMFFSDPKTQKPITLVQSYRLHRPSGTELVPEDLAPALADVIELVGWLKKSKAMDVIHIGFLGPDVAAFFLGQQLNAWGLIHLYEWYADSSGGRYVRVLTIGE